VINPGTLVHNRKTDVRIHCTIMSI